MILFQIVGCKTQNHPQTIETTQKLSKYPKNQPLIRKTVLLRIPRDKWNG